MYKNPQDTLSIAEQAKHELDLLLNDDTVAFFSVVYNARLLGDDFLDIIPTITMIHGQLTRLERLRIAEAIVNLGKSIRKSALNNEYKDDSGPPLKSDESTKNE
jgi:hypothetical protein